MEAEIRDVRIERYFPDVDINSKEFQTLGTIIDAELVDVWKVLWKQMLNTFVYAIDEDGAVRWECMLSLHPASTDSLDTRRRTILAKINAVLPYTFRSFQAMLDGIYGVGSVIESVRYGKREMWLDVASCLLYRQNAIRQLARIIIPANMTIGVSNTKAGGLQLHVAAAMRQNKHVILKPAVIFSIANSSTVDIFRRGAVQRMVHITIRSDA